MKTSTIKPSAPKWILIDAKGQTLGKIAVKAATLLRGKHKPTFSPHLLCGEHVIVINAKEIALPPKKGIRMMYHRHTGYPGNMKHANLNQMLAKKPTYVIENAVKGMLEDNRLRRQILARLHVFAEGEHPYEAQQPETISLSRTK